MAAARGAVRPVASMVARMAAPVTIAMVGFRADMRCVSVEPNRKGVWPRQYEDY